MTDKRDVYELAEIVRDAYHMSVENSTLSEAAEIALQELIGIVSDLASERDYFVQEKIKFYLGDSYSGLEGGYAYAEIMGKMRKKLYHD